MTPPHHCFALRLAAAVSWRRRARTLAAVIIVTVVILVFASAFPDRAIADDANRSVDGGSATGASSGETGGAPASAESPDLSALDAFHAVQEANRRLRAGEADRALELYDHAARRQPDAREIALGRGLAHYAKQEFDLAKEEFLKAAAGKNDPLAADAAYAASVCDHAAALASAGDAKPAMSKLENAMRGYRDLLSAHPDHASARDADRKAAAMWRELKRQLQQQSQQQKNDSDRQDQQSEPSSEPRSQDSQQSSDKQQDKQQQTSESNPSESEEKNQQQASQADASDREQPQKDAAAQQQTEQSESQNASQQNEQQSPDAKEAQAKQDSESDQQPQDPRQVQAEKEEKEASREQAERKLREMMQAVRQRRKDHRETQPPVQVAPVDKDW